TDRPAAPLPPTHMAGGCRCGARAQTSAPAQGCLRRGCAARIWAAVQSECPYRALDLVIPTPPETYGCLRGIRWACTIRAGQAPSEAPCVPSGGRPPPGARTVAILGDGAALPLTGIAAGSVTANSHIRVVVPGGGPLPPGAAVTSHGRGTPRLAPPSGCLRTTPLR